MSLTLVSSARFEDHLTPPGHPESSERAHVMDVIAAAWRKSGGAVLEPREATRPELLAVHAPEHLDRIAGTEGRAVALDPDTFTSPDSYHVALRAAGAAAMAVDAVVTAGRGARSLALVRPPGHHAERDKPMGFCFYNNAAVAAARALALGVARVAIVDYDVHHGNGTQAIFYDDPRVLYVSTHQYPYYPGTGDAGEVGRGTGAGFTMNLPLEAGATDADYDLVFTGAVLPILEQFGPGLIVISAGFDAHERDPLGGMRLSTEGYTRLTTRLSAAAERCSDGRLVAVTEGGYNLTALASCLDSTISALDGRGTDLSVNAGPATHRGHAALEAARATHKRYWRL